MPLARGRKPAAGALQRREPRLEIIGDRVLVDGLRRVLSYTSERLVLQVGKRRVTLVGADLCLLDYSPLGVQVIGTLLAVEFGDL